MKDQTPIQNAKHNAGELQEPNYIIAIGASAGDLEGILEFFGNMPDKGRFAFVLIQYLSPDHKSLLIELVSRYTSMQVLEAGHNMELHSGRVYVIPENQLMTLQRGKIIMQQRAPDPLSNNAVDTFLFSLAREKGNRAIAVILSGTGSDGMPGVEAVRAAGGLVLAQSPVTASFDGMPGSAINGGQGGHLLSPGHMPAQIIKYAGIASPPGNGNGQAVHADQVGSLTEITRLVKHYTGNDFRDYKPATIMRRIEKRMNSLDIRTLDAYAGYITENPEEANVLLKTFLIGVTRFFRDKEAYEVIVNQVLPAIVKTKRPGEVVKVWVNACSSGEEAYSLAMLLDRFLREEDLLLDFKIFATDLDEEAIAQAARGVYSLSIEKDIEQDLLAEYFVREGKRYKIIPRLRRTVVFAKHNILQDPPFIYNDLVTCRNLLIYMDGALQQKVLDSLDFSLREGGVLFLGPSEHLSSLKENYVELESKWKIFRKVQPRRWSYPELAFLKTELPQPPNTRQEEALFRHNRNQQDFTLAEAFSDLMAEENHYAAFYIDNEYEATEAMGDVARYAAEAKYTLPFHLLKSLAPELSMTVGSAIRRAWKENVKVPVQPVKIRRGEVQVIVHGAVRPAAPGKNRPTLVVLWETGARTNGKIEPALQYVPADGQHLIIELEEELQESRQNLKVAVQRLEAANKELHNSNEDLQIVNEELQSSNEELQALNEELRALNAEHQLKIRELIELNDDLDNYFASTDIGQVFVDGDMYIRKFNPAAVKMINLIASDVGRPIEHISNNIENNTLMDDVRQVLKNRELIEKEVRLSNQTTALMRIFPYVRSDKQTDGAVITFVDISTIKSLDNIITDAEQRLRKSYGELVVAKDNLKQLNRELEAKVKERTHKLSESEERFRLISQATNDAIWDWNLSNNTVWYSDTFYKLFEYEKEEVPPQRDFWLGKLHPEDRTRVNELISQIIQRKESKWSTEYRFLKGNGGYAHILDRGNLQQDEFNTPYRMLGSMMDITSLREAEKKALLNLEQKQFLADSIPMIVWTANPQGVMEFANQQFPEYTGFTTGELLQKGLEVCLHPDYLQAYHDAWHKALQERKEFSIELQMRRADGAYRWQLLQARPMMNETQELSLWVGNIMEIHERKVATDILEQRVKERTEELQRANAALEKSNTELLQYAFVASHDLKEPTRKIFMFSNMVKDNYLPDKDSKAADLLNRIIKSSQRMMRLIEDLLSYSKLSQQGVFEPVDLNQTIQEILSDLELVIQEKKATIRVAPLCKIYGMPGQIRQVFQNLVGNALKFTREGIAPQVDIYARCVAACAFDAPEDRSGKWCRIEVRDNGIGFNERFLDKIFTLFQRLHSQEKYEGTGIGLSITRKIVERHNGIITAHSKEGTGTTFVIILPMEQPGG